MERTIRELQDFIGKACSPYHTVEESGKLLTAAGFEELPITAKWTLRPGGKYYVKPYNTTLAAFIIGESLTAPMHIAAAHTDFPCLHIKPVAECKRGEYLRLDTEVYGGPILNTWMDRPLSLAGRICLRSQDTYQPKTVLFNAQKPLLTIPNLAIHLNRDVNKGAELQKQTDLLPLLGINNEAEEKYFLAYLAKQIGAELSDILDFDLFLYVAEKGCTLGETDEMFQSPRIDNLSSCLALVKGISTARQRDGLNMIVLFDHEEIGSRTKQGADSMLLRMLLEKIFETSGKTQTELSETILNSFLLSVDVAHALHPNRPEKYDAANCGTMGAGINIKLSASQRYTYDTEAVCCIEQLCEALKVPYHKYVNHSDVPGGTTLGPLISTWLPMRTVDIGIPILAMHSARELMGCADQTSMVRLLTGFFS